MALLATVLMAPFGLPFLSCGPNTIFETPPFTPYDPRAAAPTSVRAASYNIRSGLQTSLEQVGDVLADISADLVAIQEVV